MDTLHTLGVFFAGVGILLIAVGFVWGVPIQNEKDNEK